MSEKKTKRRKREAKTKKVSLGFDGVPFKLIDLEPVISRQEQERKGQVLDEIHLPDLVSSKNRR